MTNNISVTYITQQIMKSYLNRQCYLQISRAVGSKCPSMGDESGPGHDITESKNDKRDNYIVIHKLTTDGWTFFIRSSDTTVRTETCNKMLLWRLTLCWKNSKSMQIITIAKTILGGSVKKYIKGGYLHNRCCSTGLRTTMSLSGLGLDSVLVD